jgi:hypothetical protein
MTEQRIQFNTIVKNQFPTYVEEEYPLVQEFFSQYYLAQEFQSGPLDIIQNIDRYVKLDTITNSYSDETTTSSDITFTDTTISVFNTQGFPESYGLLKIDNEIITYVSKTDMSFDGCIRGFSGITSYRSSNNPEELIFSQSQSDDHVSGSRVQNLSSLFFKEFLKKTKVQIAPGFENREFFSGVNDVGTPIQLNQSTFIKQLKDFYNTKGTDESFKVLFKGLYNEEVEVIKPRDSVIRPSDAQYRVTNDIIVEAIQGNPLNLRNSTLNQNEYGYITKAYAPVTDVEKISTGLSTSNYYKISLDADYNRDIRVEGAIYGAFSIHPQTKNINEVSVGSTYIDVDSTVGFLNSGEVTVVYSDGTIGIVSYTSKTLNQLIGCSNIEGTILDGSNVGINTYAFGYSNTNPNEIIKVRVTPVLEKLNLVDDNYYYSVDDTIDIQTLGTYASDKLSNNWLLNICPTYNVKSVSLVDISDNTYNITTFDKNIFRIGDSIFIEDSTEESQQSTVVNVLNEYTFTIKGQDALTSSGLYTVKKLLSKTNSSYFPESSFINSNVQNVYKIKDRTLVASPSIPYYYNQPLNVTNLSVTFSGTFPPVGVGSTNIFNISPTKDHGFYTGDAVYYTPEKQTIIVDAEFGLIETVIISSLGEEFIEGLYFIKRIDENNIQLAKSRPDIFNEIFTSISAPVTVNSNRIDYYTFKGQSLESQKLLREISSPVEDGNVYETLPGQTGILVNGVEILNYKSSDNVYYGPIDEVEVTSPGQNYDIINPPILHISDTTGIGATGYCSVSGNLKEIRIIDPGFNYLETPLIRITGGNGNGAKASANMKLITHQSNFNSNSNASLVGIGTDISTIGFTTYHKFVNGERIIYKTNGQKAILGITTDSSYYVSVINEYTVKLHKIENDSIAGINTVSLLDYGVGNHTLQSFNKKSIIGSIQITDSGVGYENKKRTAISSGINTASDLIVIQNHGFESGEVITYSVDGVAISGITTGSNYYVIKEDNNSFRLSLVGDNQYINFESVGFGTHIFNYPEINVEIIGRVGISSLSEENFKAKVQPIFRGEIKSVHLSNNGIGYGSSDIINFYKNPQFDLYTGYGAQLTPIVSNGQIIEVLVNSVGYSYNSPPDLEIIGDGIGAVITPIIEDGQLKSVKIVEGGIDYLPATTFINVVSPGSDAKFNAKVKTWTVNNFKRNFNLITDDDGFISNGLNEDYGLQYTHVYAPRKLREILYSTDQSGKTLYGDPDLKKVSRSEIESNNHSPIIGWAYDGNPIYGPYGYSTKTGGVISQIKSGYQLNLQTNRPNFPEEFFIQDYSHFGVNDELTLDENNGRFCVTPEFPNGVYAYFATLNPTTDSSGPFRGYKRPSFPYLIGKNYKSKPIEFNYKKASNQDSVNLNDTDWIRNTYSYNLTNKNSLYSYLNIPNELKQKSDIKYALPGYVENIGIVTGGINYQINDSVIFDNTGTSGFGANAVVSMVAGKAISTVSIASSVISNVEFYPVDGNGNFILFSENPHNYLNSDIISVSGLSTTSSLLEGSFVAGVSSERYVLNVGINTVNVTGIVTYFSVSGNLDYPNIRENDIIGIGTEQIKVLNVDQKSSRIRVLRAINNVSSAHTNTTILYQKQRKLTINVGYRTNFDYTIDKEIYFNPKESVGLGTVSGVGIGTTISISNPGAGVSSIFVPTRTIYLPNHRLQTGDEVVYSLNTGSAIGVSTNGISTSLTLSDQSVLYIARVSDDLIGISTVRVGLGSLGTFVGIASTTSNKSTLYFTGIGTGTYHSFKTRYPNVVSGTIQRNNVTVSTASTHGLISGDNVYIEVTSGISTTVIVKYDDYNRRLVVNPKSFVSGGINTITSTITISNHGFYNGEKVIHTSNLSFGPEKDGIYFVIVVDNNTIKLADSYLNATNRIPTSVGITSAYDGTISQINPPIFAYKNSNITFDLSDPSLSFVSQSNNYSAFTLNFYRDSNFVELFDSSTKTNTFEVKKYGVVGISSDARVVLTVNSNLPQVLYYKLDAINRDIAPPQKQEIVIDNFVSSYNEIQLKESEYNGKQQIIVSSDSSFTYNLPKVTELDSYTSTTSNLYYETDSLNAYGSISAIKIKNGGSNYYSLPGISTALNSDLGYGAILESSSKSIGKIKNTRLFDIGYDFPSDFTIRPTTKLPQICKIDPLASFESIGITSFGRGYSTAPKLVVLDGKTNQVVSDVDLKYELGNDKVTILKNTFGIYNVTPTILPVNNSNGVGISSARYNSGDNTVAITLSVGFSTINSFPFQVNDRVLIENISVGVGSTAKGYNSENYGYNLFTIVSVAENRGGIGIVTYSMDGLLLSGEVPGNYDAINSSGRIIPEKYFPKFNPILKTNNYLKGEEVIFDSGTGTVESWDIKTNFLKIQTTKDIDTNQLIRGLSSNTRGEVRYVEKFDSNYQLNYFSKVISGWQLETGFLNDNLQRIQDSDYYQNFSYSLKSRVDYDTWKDPVSTLNHTSGFKKFSDLQMESKLSYANENSMIVGIPGNVPNVEIISDIIGVVDLNCVYDFDLVRENSLNIDSTIFSDEIIFSNRILTDYQESVGNRVLIIDDISDQFNSNPRPSKYSEVARFNLEDARSKKYITFTRDRRYTDSRQILLVTLMYDNQYDVFLNQYGRVETASDLGGFDGSADLGSFDFIRSGSEGILNFYPNKYTVNDYSVTSLSYNIKGAFTGAGSSSFGGIVNVVSTSSTTSIGSTCTIVSLGSTFTSLKALVEITGNNGQYEFTEFNLVHNGTSLEFIEYGQLTNHSFDAFSSSGLGTFYPYLTGSNINVDYISNIGVGITVNTLVVAIGNTTTSGVGTYVFDHANIHSTLTSIAATTSPVAVKIDEYGGIFEGGYFIVQASNVATGQHQLSEVIVVDDGTESYSTEYAYLETSGSLGVVGTSRTDTTRLTFTPIANTNVEVRVFANVLRYQDDDNSTTPGISLNNASIESDYGIYNGTETDIKRAFEITHDTMPVFKRYFYGDRSSIVDVEENTVIISDHYFVTGEEIIYAHAGAGTTQAIGIGTTTFAGIGATDKLPSSVYVVKVSESKIKFASSAENALKPIPNTLDLTTVGIGTSHSFTAKNQNAKVIIAIDNLIQSPLVATALTSSLARRAFTTDDIIYFTGITSFFGGDLVKIDDEVMRIDAIGIGSTNAMRVRRPWMGTVNAGHSTGALITKVVGSYNIVDNTLNFVEAPYGKNPLSSTTNAPDQRDWTGITTSSRFQGRSFLRSGIQGSSDEAYNKNYIFDDISARFNGQTKSFTLTSAGSSVSGISNENAVILINDIFQGPGISYDYNLTESVGVTSITFTGSASSISYDVNNASIPVGGVIVSVGSTAGFGYQPLVSAGGTAIVSIAGTISSISIGNSGSGYRPNQTVRVGVSTSSTGIPNIQFIGTASVSNGNIVSIAVTNPGIGYTRTNPPQVLIDSPLSYSNLPLIYSSASSGVGTQATINIVVGQGSSVIDFEIKNLGYGYGQGQILTIPVGGSTGIPTTSGFKEFQISIEKTESNKFTGWSIGELQVLDNYDNLFDGSTTVFPITLAGNLISIRSSKGSNIDVQATLIIFINDVLQVPGEGYVFNGGSLITFTEAPKPGDTSKIIFYKGSGSVDVIDRDILETVKIGDGLTIGYDSSIGQSSTLQEEERFVTSVNSTDLVSTNPYFGPGNTDNESLVRPVTWCRQTEDRIINEKEVGKDRTLYEALINPTSYLIQSVGIGSTVIFVESIRPFFNAINENNTNLSFQNKITLISQETKTSAAATAVVSIAGTISSIILSDGGFGYQTAPEISIESPIGFGTTQRASGISSITSGIVTTVSITYPGYGYTTTNPPNVLIESPTFQIETNSVFSYSGDFGIISGIKTTSVGVASTGIVFEFVIPKDSFLRNSSITGVTTISGIQTGYYFVVYNSNVGRGVTSLNSSGSTVGVGSTFLDNVYQVADVSIAQTSTVGLGVTYVARVTVSISNYNGLSGIGVSNFYGEYSWGRIVLENRTKNYQYSSYTNNGVVGLTTSTIVKRTNPLKYLNYIS